MRPQTPTLNIGPAAGVSSPPQTPTTGSPTANRLPGFSARSSPNAKAPRQSMRRSNIRPLGDGHSFSYTRGVRPEEISPRSSDSSSDDESGESDSPPHSPSSDYPQIRPQPVPRVAASIRIVHEATFVIEELDDDYLLDSDDEGGLDIIRPSGFEYAESDRSRSRPRVPADLPSEFMDNFENLNYSAAADSEDDICEDIERVRLQRREQRRIRRMTSGSISKRTVSERGSDPDEQDLLPFYDKDEAGPTMRRTRRKTDRWSTQFVGIFAEKIEELKEPDEEITVDEDQMLASELPYYRYMEVDDSD